MRSLAFLAAILLSIGSAATAEGRSAFQLVIPGTTYEITGHESQLDASAQPRDALIRAIAAWISAEFDLPAADRLPRVVRASETQMIAARYHTGDGGEHLHPPARNARPAKGHAIVALYDDRAQVIYLGEDWSGRTPAEISVLVHETVHHLQNLAGLRFACGGEREKLAYAAQDRFLGLFERSLETEFGIDPMTLLVRTTCVM